MPLRDASFEIQSILKVHAAGLHSPLVIASETRTTVVEIEETDSYDEEGEPTEGGSSSAGTAQEVPELLPDDSTTDLVIVGLMLVLVGGTGGLAWHRRNTAISRGQRVGTTGLAAMDDASASHEAYAMDMELNDAAQTTKEAGWSIRLEFRGGQPHFEHLSLNAASNPVELKQAILEVCLSRLGPEMTPASWLNGRFDLMAVQFMTTGVRVCKI